MVPGLELVWLCWDLGDVKLYSGVTCAQVMYMFVFLFNS